MNKILLEGKNDKAFIDAYIKYLTFTNNISTEIATNKLENGFSEEEFTRALIEIKNKEIDDITHLGIIVDIDNSAQEKINTINNCFNKVFQIENVFQNEATIYSFNFNNKTTNVSLFLMKDSNGKGELMNVLREIKNQNSTIADCIENCCSKKVDFNQKAFDDDWSHFYMKWDCNNLEARTNKDNFTLALTIDSKIKDEEKINKLKEGHYQRLVSFWDFEHDTLKDLRNYLNQFQ